MNAPAKFWDRLPFTGRLLFTATIALLFGSLFLLYTTTARDALEEKQAQEYFLQASQQTLPAAMAEILVVGDYAALQQTLHRYLSHPDVLHLRFQDRSDAVVEASKPPTPHAAPSWFHDWLGMGNLIGSHDFMIGGRYYGRLQIELSPNQAINRAWESFWDHLIVIALVVLLDFIGIWLVLHAGLRPLQMVVMGSQQMAQGILSARLPVHGSPEIQQLMQGFNSMADALQNARTALLQEKEFLQVTLASIADGVIISDQRGAITFLNKEAARLLGWQAETAIGQSLRQLVRLLDANSREELDNPLLHVLHSRQTMLLPAQTLLRTHQNREYPIAGIAAPIRMQADAAPLGVVMLFRDQSQERQRWQTLLEARQQAEAANRAKGEFLATMSHEIRTPMHVVIGMGDLLLETPLNDLQRGYVNKLQNAGQNLLDLLNRILDLSQMEAGQLQIQSEPLQLPDLLHEVVALLQVVANNKGLTLRCEIDASTPLLISSDRLRLQQILFNLLGNAVKFTDQGSVLLQCRYATTEQKLHFTITDTGMGIPEQELQRIFAPFTQLDSGMTRRHGGSGLGLAITRRLITLLGGTIAVESQPGQGSCFRIQLPVIPLPALSLRTTPPNTNIPAVLPGHSAALSILLVEDMEENQLLLRAFLKETSHQLTLAHNGAEAVALVQQHSYDLILMDIQMPIMDGYTATRQIRLWEKEHGQPTCPIIALTAHALEGEAKRSQEAGCQLHLTKPLKKKHLLDILRQFSTSSATDAPTLSTPAASTTSARAIASPS
ncbi:hybrid sensor histidine kinase/response regulator [Candidatus Magnetaquicoccus inordinatus]|uniref:hybrid sensor histidine kinase/response regulator n=1 Tax=Candidatus Magnetaquicoccus inordinatus TaxID=2496818 RepID=UPI00187D27F3|nr:ATP-binding protein [Candidatus Magnetaquicoccus inordinatus]